MSRRPPPPLYAKSRPGEVLEAAELAADQSIAAAFESQKAAKKAIAAVPIPDPRDNVNFQRLAGQEQTFLARLSPRHRNRWPEFVAIEDRIAELDMRQEELRLQLGELRSRREGADVDHAARLAAWLAGDQQSPRPGSEVRELEEQIVEAMAEHDAIDIQREHVLEEKIQFVKKHRKRLVRQADAATEAAKVRYLELVDALAQAREELIGARETAVYAACYPSEHLSVYAPTFAICGGLQDRVERHLPGVRVQLPAHELLALLRDDAAYVESVATVDQAAQIQGVSKATLSSRFAVWSGSEEDLAHREKERKRAREEYERTFGKPSPDW